jgi:hypothetical protein
MKIIAPLFLLAGVLCAPAFSQSSECESQRPPKHVELVLKNNFPAWRIQQPSDLPPEYVELWKKAHPGECPGVANGHFSSSTHLSCAVLLVPLGEGQGYRLLIFDNINSHGTRFHLVEKIDLRTSTPDVIYRVPPGLYSDAQKTRRVRVHRDGLILEQLEVGSILYYREEGRFRKLIISE